MTRGASSANSISISRSGVSIVFGISTSCSLSFCGTPATVPEPSAARRRPGHRAGAGTPVGGIDRLLRKALFVAGRQQRLQR
jgi:hypothetical protein